MLQQSFLALQKQLIKELDAIDLSLILKKNIWQKQ
jgi:hypothetical protein